MVSAPAPRRLSAWLLIGLLAAAPLFVWLLLRRGYPPSLRRAAFGYTAVMLAVTLLGRIGTGFY